MFSFGSLIAFLHLLASFTALALTIVISVAMAEMKSQLRDGSSTFIVTTCCLQTAGCGKSFQGTDPYILSQLPRHVQEAFPAILTVRAAVDKQLISLMHTCFSTRFGPEPFAALMREMRHLDHAHRELLYLAAATSSV